MRVGRFSPLGESERCAMANTSKYKIQLSPPETSSREEKYLKEALASNELSLTGKQVDQFRERLQDLTGSQNILPLSSGTAALQLALHILGIESGDMVVCPSFTYAASSFPILYHRAKPCFIDAEPGSWNLDPNVLDDTIRQFATRGLQLPKAIIAVHIYGMPCNIKEILNIGSHYGIPVLEDAAESIGSTIKGQHTGAFGELGILSFNGNKIITTSGGGALLAQKPDYISLAKKLASQAREEGVGYSHEEVGYNYLMGNINAAVGLGQLEVLKERIQKHRMIFNFYRSELSDLDLEFQHEPEGYFSNRWLTCVLFKDHHIREKVRRSLEENHIEARPLWKPMHMQPVFKGENYFGGKISENLFERGLCLPSGSSMTEDDLDSVVEGIKKVFNRNGC